MFGTFVALQKILTSKAKKKKNYIVSMVDKKNKLCVKKNNKNLWSLFMDGVQLPQLGIQCLNHYSIAPLRYIT